MESIASASSMSRCDSPCASCVVSVIATRFQTLVHSGWWSAFSAISATCVMKPNASGKSVKTIDRVIDVFPAAEKEMVRAMLSESLRAVISQSLLKTKDGQGRVAAHEIMIGTPAIRNLIREAKVAQMNSAIQTGHGHGMQTLDQNLSDLVRRNVISMPEARAAAQNKDNFPG